MEVTSYVHETELKRLKRDVAGARSLKQQLDEDVDAVRLRASRYLARLDVELRDAYVREAPDVNALIERTKQRSAEILRQLEFIADL